LQEFSKSYKKTDLASCLKLCCLKLGRWPTLLSNGPPFKSQRFRQREPKIKKLISTLAKLAK